MAKLHLREDSGPRGAGDAPAKQLHGHVVARDVDQAGQRDCCQRDPGVLGCQINALRDEDDECCREAQTPATGSDTTISAPTCTIEFQKDIF